MLNASYSLPRIDRAEEKEVERRDTALAISIIASLIFVIAVGVSSSARPAAPDFVDRPIALMVRFAETDRILRITDPVQVSAVAMWLDAAFKNPRSKFDLRLLPPASNEMEVKFESGHITKVFFSGSRSSDDRTEALRRIHHRDDLYVVQYEGASYTIDGVPQILVGYLQLAERKRLPLAWRRPHSQYSHMKKDEPKVPVGMIDHFQPEDEEEEE